MARKTFTTTINERIIAEFKNACSEKDLKMNEVLEAFMKGFIEGKFSTEKEVTVSFKKN